MPDDIARFRAAGMSDHLGKPIPIDAFEGVLERWCSGQYPGSGYRRARLTRWQPAWAGGMRHKYVRSGPLGSTTTRRVSNVIGSA
jgi:hypothetical protein